MTEKKLLKNMGLSPEASQKTIQDKDADSTKKVNQKNHPIDSYSQLIRLVYDNAFKRSRLKPSEIKKLGISPVDNVCKSEEILELTRQDVLLEKTRQLMLLGLRTDNLVARRIMEFSCCVLRRHPFFNIEPLLNAVSSTAESAYEIGIIDVILDRKFEDLNPKDSEATFKEDSFKILKTNAAHCLILHLTLNNVPLLKIHALFQRLIHHKKSSSAVLVNEQVYTLITARTPEAVAVSFRLLDAQLADQRRLINNAVADKKSAETRADFLEGKIRELEEDLALCKKELVLLSNKAEQAAKIYGTEKECWRDDYEQLRGNVLRRINEEVNLLAEGLTALTKDPPKIHVMIDHAQRVIEGLNLEMKQIRGDG